MTQMLLLRALTKTGTTLVLVFALALALVVATVGSSPAVFAADFTLNGEWHMEVSGSWFAGAVGVDGSGGEGRLDGEAGSSIELRFRSPFEMGNVPGRLYADAMADARLDVGPDAPDVVQTETSIKRLYASVFPGKTALKIGRQPISWGVGEAWAPTDVFNQNGGLLWAEDAPGIDSIVVRVSTGPFAYWSGVLALLDRSGSAVMGGRVNGEKAWSYGIRYHGHTTGGTDWSAVAAYSGDSGRRVVGVDLKRDLEIGPDLILGAHGEVALSSGADSAEMGALVLAGLDYSWDGRLFWLGEYLYDSKGASKLDDYDYAGWLTGDVDRLGRHYLFNRFSFKQDEFTDWYLSALNNLVDGSAVLGAGVRFVPWTDWSMTVGVSVPTGHEGTEYGPGDLQVLETTVARSSMMLMTRLSYSF